MFGFIHLLLRACVVRFLRAGGSNGRASRTFACNAEAQYRSTSGNRASTWRRKLATYCFSHGRCGHLGPRLVALAAKGLSCEGTPGFTRRGDKQSGHASYLIGQASVSRCCSYEAFIKNEYGSVEHSRIFCVELIHQWESRMSSNSGGGSNTFLSVLLGGLLVAIAGIGGFMILNDQHAAPATSSVNVTAPTPSSTH